jgi:hypothetical protein
VTVWSNVNVNYVSNDTATKGNVIQTANHDTQQRPNAVREEENGLPQIIMQREDMAVTFTLSTDSTSTLPLGLFPSGIINIVLGFVHHFCSYLSSSETNRYIPKHHGGWLISIRFVISQLQCIFYRGSGI